MARFPSAPSQTLISADAYGKGTSRSRTRRACLIRRGRLYCGPTLRVRLALDSCAPLEVDAIAARLPQATAPVVLGRDFLERAVQWIDRSGAIVCRRRRVLRVQQRSSKR